MTSSDGSDRHRVDRRWAEQEFELYERHNRPPRPYYMKCLRCGEMREIEGSLLRAEDAVRRHAGVHGGLKEEHAEIVATDAHGRELLRTHAIFKPEDEPQGCPECDAETDSDRVACPECGHIPDEDRLVADGGTDTGGSERGVTYQKTEGADSDRDWNELELGYDSVSPNRWTFQSDKIRKWVQERLRGRVLNACAGKTRLAHDHEIVRNDIDEQRNAGLHVDVCEIAEHFEREFFDTVVYDPPFTDYQANRSYDGQQVGNDALAKQQFDALLRPGGRVIQFGYTTTCMPNELGYHRKTAWIWNTLGRMNDYLSVVDEKPGELETEPRWFRSLQPGSEHIDDGGSDR